MDLEIPLMRKWYEINSWIMETSLKYPKSIKFTLVDRIINTSIDIMDGIIVSIYEKNRISELKKINIDLERLRIYMRLSLDKKYISIRQHEFISKEINEAGKMLGGWIKKSKIKIENN